MFQINKSIVILYSSLWRSRCKNVLLTMAKIAIPCVAVHCDYKTIETEDTALAERLLDKHIQVEHAPAAPPVANRNMREKQKKPQIDLEMSEAKWRDFENQWSRYKRSSGVTGQEVVDDLVQCLSDALRLEITSELGDSLEKVVEKDLLEAIRRMAVLESNPMVHRNDMRVMVQGESEKIRGFVARLREAAIDCKFEINCKDEMCNGVTTYKEEIIRDQCVFGLRCKDTQAKILALGSGLPTLESVIIKAEAEEQAKLAQNKLTRGIKQEAMAEVSVVEAETSGASKKKCKFCGWSGHGRSPDEPTRKKSCKAYGQTCYKCEGPNHFANMCVSKKVVAKNNALATDGSEKVNSEASFLAIKATLGNVDWDKEAQHWVERKPRSMPQMRVDIKVLVEDHKLWHPNKNLGKYWPGPGTCPGKLSQEKSIADTGAMVTCSGTHLLHKLNISPANLIPTSQVITAANNKILTTLGAVMIEVTARRNGKERTTKQFCYICKEVTGLYLSLSACEDLDGVLPWNNLKGWAGVNSVLGNKDGDSGDDAREGPQYGGGHRKAQCGCPVRSDPPPMPKKMPFGEKEVDKLQSWLLDRYAASAFNVCTHQPLTKMSGPPVNLVVDPNIPPVAKHIPAPIPWHFREKVKEGLDADCRMDVIEEVPVNRPADWMSRLVVTPKKDGSPRRTVDLSSLNKACKRQTHHTRSPYHLASDIPRNMKKSCYDAWNGFHSVSLEEQSRQYTKFITQWGAYQYKVLPQGWLSANDAYSKRYDTVIKDVEDYVKCIDDVCQWDETVEGCFWKACRFLELGSQNGITFNPDKFVFARDTVEYVGFEITRDSVKPAPSMLKAIKEFPAPTNITSMRSFFGLVNQVSFAFSMKDTMAPFRELLRPSSEFYWDDKLQHLFEEAREEIVRKVEAGVRMFEMDRITCVAPDWSKEGVGFFLFQKHCDCPDVKMGCCKEGWQLIMAGSRFLRQNEKNWYPGEGEALAVVYALNKSKYFVLGCKKLYVATDHKPLLGTFGDRDLEQVDNPRLRRLKEKTMMFDFKMIHVPARKHAGPDALSRNPVCKEGLLGDMDTKEARRTVLAAIRIEETSPEMEMEDPAKEEAENKLATYVCPILASMGIVVKAVTWERVQQAALVDPVMQELVGMVEEGFPDNRSEVSDSLKEFFKLRDSLRVSQGVVMYNGRVVVPRSLRREVLEGLHAGHQGVVSMKARASDSVFWPGLDRSIQDVRDRCRICDYIAPSQADESAVTAEPPVYPFQKVSTDYFQLDGATYLVIVDRYSGWPSVFYLPATTATSKSLVDTLRKWFTVFGVPEEMSSDGQSTYTSQLTKEFLSAWGVRHRLSLTYFPHSNSRAELGVKAMKRLLRENAGPRGDLDTNAFARAMLMYRNTPMQGVGLSPAQIVFGRKIRDTMPFAPGMGAIHKEWRITAEDREKALSKRHHFNLEKLNEHVKDLKPLVVGQSVLVQNQSGHHAKRWARTGTVVEVGPGPRQYMVRMDGSRNVSLRNRKFLRPFVGVSDVMAGGHDLPAVKEHGGHGGKDSAVQIAARPSHAIGPQVDEVKYVPTLVPEDRNIQPSSQEPVPAPVQTPAHTPAQSPASSPASVDGPRYPRRERRLPAKLKDFEVEVSGLVGGNR